MANQTINPTTNDLIKTYPIHTDADIEAALTAAHRLYKVSWSQGPTQPRLEVPERFADLIDARAAPRARRICSSAALSVRFTVASFPSSGSRNS